MKTYEKPRMMVLSISVNDTLCSTCSISTRNNYDVSAPLIGAGIQDLDGDGWISESEANGFFAQSENDCGKKIDMDIYCKFTSASATKLFNS